MLAPARFNPPGPVEPVPGPVPPHNTPPDTGDDTVDTDSNSGQAMAEFDVEDGTDPADIISKTSTIKVDFDRTDINFFFGIPVA